MTSSKSKLNHFEVQFVILLPVDGVVLEEVAEVIEVHERIVDGHNASLASVGGEGGPEGEAADSAEAVDSESGDGHGSRTNKLAC